MKDLDYTFSVAYVRTLENKMLSRSDIDSIMNAENAEDAMKILADKGYGGGEKKSAEELSELLSDELENTWSLVSEMCPKDAPIKILLYKNDFQNLKTIIKALQYGIDYKSLMLRPCTMDPDLIAKSMRSGDFSELPEFMESIARGAFELVTKTGDGQLLEVYLDRKMFETMYDEIKSYKSDFLEKWIELNCDAVNCSIILRGSKAEIDERIAEEALIPIGKIQKNEAKTAILEGVSAAESFLERIYPDAVKSWKKSTSEFEKWKDNLLSDYLKASKYKAFGIEPVLAFLKGKETEIQAVRMIINGIKNNIPKSNISERLRELYV